MSAYLKSPSKGDNAITRSRAQRRSKIAKSVEPADASLLLVRQNPIQTESMKTRKRQMHRNRLLRFKVGEKLANYVFLPTTKTKGQYARRLGDGGSGVVFLVGQKLHSTRQIKRAIKFFLYRPDVADRINIKKTIAVSQKEFINEIANFSQLSHESLVKVIDANIYTCGKDEFPYIVTDFIEGPTLRQLVEQPIEQKGRDILSQFRIRLAEKPEQVLIMLLAIARAIKYMHDRQFYHCDIAPKNIFLKQSENYRPIIGDLGLGLCFGDPRKRVRVAGTKLYMPPEVEAHYGRYIPWDTYVRMQPRWDLYSYAKTGLELAQLIPDRGRFRWRRPLVECLEACRRGERYFKIDDLIDQLEWLSPVGRVPELAPSLSGQQKRIIPVDSLIISERVRRLTNHPAVLRLATIKQLTMAKHVFPGAIHTRYEHALGAMETMRRYLLALVESPDFLTRLNSPVIETALICALLSNLTRHPLHNILGEIRGIVPEYDSHFDKVEMLNELFMERKNGYGRTLHDLIRADFPAVDCDVVRNILLGQRGLCQTAEEKLVFSMLNCSLDVRVADFIRRDSIHLGVSGFAFDLDDLLGQLTVNDERLALRASGIGSAEQLIAMRYWLFSRIYWNAPNRAYVTMMRYCLYRLGRDKKFVKLLRKRIFESTEEEILKFCLNWASRCKQSDVEDILRKVCQPEQPLFRVVLQVSPKEDPELTTAWRGVAEMDFRQMLGLADKIEAYLRKKYPQMISDKRRRVLLVDMPPDEKDAGNKLGQDIMVVRTRGKPIGLVGASEIVAGVNRSFSEQLRRLRIYCHPVVLEGKSRQYRETLEETLTEALRNVV